MWSGESERRCAAPFVSEALNPMSHCILLPFHSQAHGGISTGCLQILTFQQFSSLVLDVCLHGSLGVLILLPSPLGPICLTQTPPEVASGCVCMPPRPSWALDAVLGAEGVQPLGPALRWGAFGQHRGK